MAIFEVLEDGSNEWHFSHDVDAPTPEIAAQKYAEETDYSSTEFRFVQQGGFVQVRRKGGNPISRYEIHGETRPYYYARLTLPNPTEVK
jgi:hypothetical protein